jgi:hypothetical protein
MAEPDVRFTPKADMCGATRYVRFVPIANIRQPYSLIRSRRRRG